jgi:hypothetical protein
MSVPISAMIAQAAVRPTPQISSSRSAAAVEGADQLLELAVQLGDVSLQPIHPAQHRASRNP